MSRYDKRDSLIDDLLAKPDSVQLFRGQKASEPMGIHFTPDEAWAKNFGTVMKMTLPANAKVKLLTPEDTERGLQEGICDETVFWQTFFDDGYDAIIGTDSHDSTVLDVIVNPKLLGSR
jgi:hypothetical protein